MRYLCGLSIAIMLLTGCATNEVGHPFHVEALPTFQVGITTIEQAEAAMGQPYQIMHNSANGHTRLFYQHIYAHANGLTGHGHSTSDWATVDFDESGHFLRYNSATGGTGKSRVD
jgi:hypothetical protein